MPLLAACVLLLSACGGSASFTEGAAIAPETAAPDTGASGTPVASKTPGSDTSDEAGAGEIVAKTGEDPGSSDVTPKEFVEAKGKRTILVILHQPKSQLDDLVVKEAIAGAKGGKSILVLSYAAGDHEAYGDLPERLGMYGTPSIAIVTRSGKLQNFWTGYVDRNLIRASLLLAERTKPAKVTDSDAQQAGDASGAAPAAGAPAADAGAPAAGIAGAAAEAAAAGGAAAPAPAQQPATGLAGVASQAASA